VNTIVFSVYFIELVHLSYSITTICAL